MPAGVLGFVAFVVFLHRVQPNYDPLEQRISELALGRFGSLMVLAFSSFALAVFALQTGLRRYSTPNLLRPALIAAACCLFGAGLFRLDTAADIHVALVSIAFILIVLVMYLVPRNVAAFATPLHKGVSWGLAAGTAVFVAMGDNLLPLGLAQRGAALCILAWLAWMGLLLARDRENNR